MTAKQKTLKNEQDTTDNNENKKLKKKNVILIAVIVIFFVVFGGKVLNLMLNPTDVVVIEEGTIEKIDTTTRLYI